MFMARQWVATFLLASAACGSGGGTSTPPPSIDPSLGLANLDATQKDKLCDWEAMMLGGYGATPTCADGSGSVSVPANQADCVAKLNFSVCAALVGNEFNCVDVVAQLPCESTLLNAPECQAVITCK
jgi:hypothetical protein